MGCGRPTPEESTNDLQGIPALAAALGDYRPFPLRLTGGFRHAPCANTAPPLCAPVPLEDPQVNQRLIRLEGTRAARRPDRQTLRGVTSASATNTTDPADAVWDLVLHLYPHQIDGAVARLERAVEADPTNADLHNDLAVAYAAQSTENPLHHGALRFQALAAAAEAVRHDPDHPEGLFNLALLQAEMGLRHPAAETWRHFLEIETDPGWRAEAEEHLATVSEPREIDSWSRGALEAAAEAQDEEEVQRLVQLSPHQTYIHLRQGLFPTWGEAYLAGEVAGAEDARAKLAVIVPLLTEEVRDWEAADNLAIIEADPGNPEANRRRRALASGLVGLRELSALPGGCSASQHQRLQEARQALKQVGVGSVASADWGVGVCVHWTYEFRPAVEVLDRALHDADPDRYPLSTAYLHRQRGLDLNFAGDPWASRSTYQTALAILENTADRTLAHSIRMLLASLLQDVGLEQEGWSERYALVRALADLPHNHAAMTLLSETARFLAERGDLAAALQFQNEVIRRHEQDPDLPILAALHRSRAPMLSRMGDTAAALRDVEHARELIVQSDDEEEGREGFLLYLTATQGEVLRDSDPQAALQLFIEAIEGLHIRPNPDRLAEALVHRADLYLENREPTRAEEDLEEALAVLEKSYRTLEDDRERRAFLITMGPIYRRLIGLVSESSPPLRTLELADVASGRSLLQSSSPFVPLGLEDALDSLPPEVAVVQYLSTADKTLCWVLTAGDSPVEVSLDLSTRDAADLRRRAVQALGGDRITGESTAVLRELYERLLAPTLDALGTARVIVIVADGPLQGIPFGALIDPSSGRYLVEDHTVLAAPSVSIAVALAERRARRGPWQPQQPLVVGDPRFDPPDFPELPPLPAAREVAGSIAALYPAPTVLLEADAQAGAFLELLERHDLLHFGGHALPLPEPALILAPDEGHETGALTSRDLDRAMPHLRLAILSACSTAGETATLDLQSLVWPFLVAGADGVIASLWPVLDPPTAELMLRLHRHLAEGLDPLTALTRVQRSMIADPDPTLQDPGMWGAFVLFGTY
jgi:CHAT domain-containing protein